MEVYSMKMAIRYTVLACLFVWMVLISPAGNAEGRMTLPAGLQVIETEAFYGTQLFDKVVIPEGTTEIHSRAFVGCSLTEVMLPSTLTYIADDAFDIGTDMVISVPADCYAYDRCVELGLIEAADVEETPATWFTYTISDGKVTITGFDSSSGLTKVVVPGRIEGLPVTAIGSNVFSNYAGLADLILPQGLESIGAEAFSNCDGLTTIVIPNTVTFIGDTAFSGCDNLTKVTTPFAWSLSLYPSNSDFPFENCA
ncbi:MAG: leucine-rich repeat domain-containing protein, partial [Clostridiales bacterium]|nr:leucine-rich repeat domain-containing protein [Clostridiales bacterium]